MYAQRPQAAKTSGVPVPQLAMLRKRAALSQRALAERAGLHMQTISRLECGGNARYSTISLLAKALDIPPARLVRPTRHQRTLHNP